MTKNSDMLLLVRAELSKRDGELRRIATATGIAYDTVRRIKLGSHDPGYSRVQRLAVHFGFAAPITAAVLRAAGIQQ
jgi:hypothetical protein